LAKDKRSSPRSKCLLPADLEFKEKNKSIAERTTVYNISSQGLKLVVNFKNFEVGSPIDLKVYLPEKKLSTALKGEVTWNKYKENKLEVGIKIKKMNQEAKSEILSWVFPRWVKIDKENKKEKKREKKAKKK